MWLQKILKQHEELESPAVFWLWAAFAAVSAVVKDNVYIDKFAYKVYPNIYVLLHADSGLKKGPPISMARQLVENTEVTKVFSGRFSIQGFLKELSSTETKPGGQIIGGSSGFICLSELTSSIVNDPFAFDIITDLYDRNYRSEKWRSVLKQEIFEMSTPPVVSFIAGTNPAHADEFFGKKDLQGGFFARTFVVYAKDPNNVNSLMYPPKEKIDYKEAAIYLKEISKLKGPFEIEDRKFFDDWYKSFKESMKKQEFHDPTGTLNRFDDAVHKVSMLVTLANEPTLIIKREYVEYAIDACTKLVGNMRRTTFGRGKHSFAPEKALLIQELVMRDGHMMSRQLVNQKYWNRASAEDWDDIANSLVVAGLITIDTIGHNVVYRMDELTVEKMLEHFGGKL